MAGQKIGYIRVSSVDQNTERQLSDIDLDKTFTDKLSGMNTKRPQLQECISYMRNGDQLFVHSIDRLARNLQDLQEIVEQVTDKGALVIFVKENLRFSGDDDPMSKVIMQVMGAIAEFQRTLIKSAQREGIEKAKAAGKYNGGPSLNEEKIDSINQLANSGKTKVGTAATVGVSLSTVYKYWPKEANKL